MKLKTIPFLLSFLTMFGGVFIAIMFGANEEFFINKIQTDLNKNEKIISIADPVEKSKKIKSEEEKNWRYYQRFHFHATGIGSMSLVILICLSFISAPTNLILINSFLISIGGFLYPFVWLFAGIYGPLIGRSEAKEAFAIFGYSGGLFLVGIILACFLLIKYPLEFKKS